MKGLSLTQSVRFIVIAVFVLFALQTAFILFFYIGAEDTHIVKKNHIEKMADITAYYLTLDEEERRSFLETKFFQNYDFESLPADFQDYPEGRRIRRLEVALNNFYGEIINAEGQNKSHKIKAIALEPEWKLPLISALMPPASRMIDVFVPIKDEVLRIRTKGSALMLWAGARILIFYLVTTLMIVFCVFYIIRTTTRPFLALNKAARKAVGDGSFNPVYIEQRGQETSQVRNAIDAFNHMQDKIAGLLHERRMMLAALSHDLKTILTRLTLRLDYIGDKNQRTKAQSDLIFIERYLNQMACFSRSEMIDELSMEGIDPVQSIAGISESYESADFKITFDTPDLDNMPHVYADRVAFERIVHNILSNAARYSSQIKISINEIRQAKQCVIDFADNGPGLKEEQKQSAFKPFFNDNAERDKSKSGSGLGFAIIANLAERMSMKVELLDNLPTGLTVRLICQIKL